MKIGVGKTRNFRLVPLSVLTAGLLLGALSTAGASEAVDLVGCPGELQGQPTEGPTAAGKRVDLDSESAARLSYYQAFEGMGVLAPKGWHCFQWSSDALSTFLVAPASESGEDAAWWRGAVKGPAVVVEYVKGGAAGRFATARYIRWLFPGTEHDYIQAVIDERIIKSKKLQVAPHPGDVLIRKNARLVEFTTPAKTAGLGTSAALQPSSDPVIGVASLDAAGDDGDPEILLVAVRLPENSETLQRAIVQNAESAIIANAAGKVRSAPATIISYFDALNRNDAKAAAALVSGDKIATSHAMKRDFELFDVMPVDNSSSFRAYYRYTPLNCLGQRLGSAIISVSPSPFGFSIADIVVEGTDAQRKDADQCGPLPFQ